MSEPKYKSQNARLVAVVDAFSDLTGRKSFTIAAVSKWAIANRLNPFPRPDCTPEEATACEEKLAAIARARHR
jgi:hypothetical protein